MIESPLLVADIGGTNARFALVGGPSSYHSERALRCADYSGPKEAIQTYLEEVGASIPRVICIAAAGPVIDGQCKFTNSSWEISEAALANAFASPRIALINDFAATALGLADLCGAHCLQVGPLGAPLLTGDDFSLAVIGPGTGLGVAGLLRREGVDLPLVTEAGHVGFAPESELQCKILENLQTRFDRVSVERILSGAGVSNLYEALAAVMNYSVESLDAAEIFHISRSTPEHPARVCTNLFFEILGQVAGDMVLTLGAQDGVFIAGGIVQRYPDMLVASEFRSGFENKGRHRELLERVPTLLIEHPYPGLFGAALHARQLAVH